MSTQKSTSAKKVKDNLARLRESNLLKHQAQLIAELMMQGVPLERINAAGM